MIIVGVTGECWLMWPNRDPLIWMPCASWSRVPGESGRLWLADVVAAGVRPGRAVARLWAGRGPVRVTVTM